MADPARIAKVQDRIKTTVARLLERKIKDPRLGFVTITDCRITGDLQHATVFYTVLGRPQERKKTGKALESAKGLIRSEVGRALGIRLTPTITFMPDQLPQQAASFETLLKETREKDRSLADAAQHAQYAGEADPYRHEEDDPADLAESTAGAPGIPGVRLEYDDLGESDFDGSEFSTLTVEEDTK